MRAISGRAHGVWIVHPRERLQNREFALEATVGAEPGDRGFSGVLARREMRAKPLGAKKYPAMLPSTHRGEESNSISKHLFHVRLVI